ncbi:MAG: SMI1/KNR4 family protein [Neptuniibacter sp.]
MLYFKEVTDYFEQHELEAPVGSASEDIALLERKLGFKFPKAYKEFLELIGNDYNGVMIGTNCFLSDIESNNNYLPDLLIENNIRDYKLPNNYISFFCHQGYIMAWFSLPSKNDDPQCYYYFEGTTKYPELYGTFSEFMKKDLLGNAKLRVENRNYDKMSKKWWQFWK